MSAKRNRVPCRPLQVNPHTATVISVVLAGSVVASASAGPLFPRPQYTVDGVPSCVALGDLDSDGNLDMAVGKDASRHELYVLLGHGDGTFADGLAFDVGGRVGSVAVADLDGDGHLDVVAANIGDRIDHDDPCISVLLNQGDGTFKEPAVYESARRPDSVAIGDFNGDGKPDLAVAHTGRYPEYGDPGISILLNDGNGTFADPVEYDAGDRPNSIALGDLDGDGDLDLAVANSGDDNISILLNLGDGTFGDGVTYPVGDNPSSIVSADLDGDGDLDVAVGALDWDPYRHGTVSVLLNQGNASLGDMVTYNVGEDEPISMALGDLDGDGDLDLTAADGDGRCVWILSNHGAGVFAEAVGYGIGSGPRSVALGDLNGDRRPDVVAACGGHTGNVVSVLLNRGDGRLANNPTYRVARGPSSLVTADLDGDDDLDLAAGSWSNEVSVLLNHGDGTFAEPLTSEAAHGSESLGFGDLDGDGDLDLATPNLLYDNVSVLLNHGDGTFAEQGTYRTGREPVSVAIADLSGDGTLDLAVATALDGVSILLNRGDGTFGDDLTHGVPGELRSVAAGDLDRDGDVDLAVASSNVVILLNSGDGTFVEGMDYDVGGAADLLAIADLDGDEDLDLAATNFPYWGSNVSVLLNHGDGTFANYVLDGSPEWHRSLVIRDVDGDDHPDLIVVKSYSNSVSLLLNQGDGTFAQDVLFGTGYGPSAVAAGDFDSDGDIDLAVGNGQEGSISVLLSQLIVDCNHNGINDDCDIDCGVPGGPCDVPGCGQSDDCNENADPDECDIAHGKSTDGNGNGIPDECEVFATLDIKPGSCPNPLNPRSRGKLPVALVGSGLFDVSQIDTNSVFLSRADGVGGSAAPLMGPPGPGISVEDVATPFQGEPCACHGSEGDGIDDLVLKFSTPDLADVLELNSPKARSTVELVLRGSLLDGRVFQASDCVSLRGQPNHADLRSHSPRE